ncbi:hypothetical protein [Streptomyces sp. NBC_00878]|uniref:hypothetical protein n=1 Tax=Streptomyces sp. NBC_00878 TaxID=2975854 RepID=UPI00225951A9|nr:hypothetical protein [Streptomyces sp. NBC_00878]MCX4904760.1 hypothetical protein [Streptomyces sp. NBC_00878]
MSGIRSEHVRVLIVDDEPGLRPSSSLRRELGRGRSRMTHAVEGLGYAIGPGEDGR